MTMPGFNGFWDFYHGAYANDHSCWPNRALHHAGVVSGLALLVASVTIIPIWWALAFPLLHALPGLIGHWLFERNAQIGDLRVFDGTYPGIWFMTANHIALAQAVRNVLMPSVLH
jgi:hypothetical protein